MSPEALQQSHSLPSSVSDALEAMVGGGLDDLTLEDIDPTTLAEDQQQSEVLEISCHWNCDLISCDKDFETPSCFKLL